MPSCHFGGICAAPGSSRGGSPGCPMPTGSSRSRSPDGAVRDETYDELVVTAGAVTRTFAIPGVLENAIGMKQIEEAIAIRNSILTSFDRAAGLPAGPERARLLTVTFVGGGFSGVEGFGETLSFAHALLRRYPEIHENEIAFHLVEATSRVLPEVGQQPGRWVVPASTLAGRPGAPPNRAALRRTRACRSVEW